MVVRQVLGIDKMFQPWGISKVDENCLLLLQGAGLRAQQEQKQALVLMTVSVEVQTCCVLEVVAVSCMERAQVQLQVAVELLFFVLQFRNPVASVGVP